MKVPFARFAALIVFGLLMPACGSRAGGGPAESGGAAPSSSQASPPAPTGLTAAPGDRIVILSWNPVTGAGGYNVKRSAASGGPYAPVAVFFPDTLFIDSPLRNGAIYFYVVSAVNNVGEGPDSLEASATPGERRRQGSDHHDSDYHRGHGGGGESGAPD